jgi:heme a synthase
MSSKLRSSSSKAVSLWIFIMIIMVVSMILLGGATRLTNSGLSITEWRPITGALPPLSDTAWASEFDKYQQIPEFSAEHPSMDLASFKFIYFMEWSHRQLGRLIGLVYFVPLGFFLWRKKIPGGRRGRFIAILLLIGLQGAIGWWMVASGLVHGRVDVSQYRLAVHLGTAFFILALLLWTWLDNRQNWPEMSYKVKPSVTKMQNRITVLFILVFLQVLAGAFVAGTHAGLTYNTWPLMDGGLVPGGYFSHNPLWINIFENVASIQFNHRMLGYAVFLMAMWVWASVKRLESVALRRAMSLLMVTIFGQIALGVATLLYVVPMKLALLHQAGAIVVFLLSAWTLRIARYRTIEELPRAD